jgi:hypothetical protein
MAQVFLVKLRNLDQSFKASEKRQRAVDKMHKRLHDHLKKTELLAIRDKSHYTIIKSQLSLQCNIARILTFYKR